MFKLLKNFTKKEKLIILISIVLIVLQSWLELKLPDYMSNITILVQTPGSEMNAILKEGLFMMLCALGGLVLNIGKGYGAAYVGSSFEKNLRRKVFTKVESFGMEEIKKFSTSSLITRNTNDITQIKMFVTMAIQMMVKAPIMAVMAVLKIFNKEFEFSMLTLTGVVLIVLLNLIIILVAIPKFKKIQMLTDNLNKVTRENLTGLKVVRAYNAEEYQLNKFNKANSELTDTHLFVQKIMALIGPFMSSVMQFLSLGIYFIGAFLINQANIMDRLNIFSDMVVFSSYAVQVIMSFMMLVMIFIIYPRASVSANRINEVLDMEPKIKDGKISKDTTDLKGEIEFKNVSFKYPDAEEYVLKDISFKANKGETIAIIGSTGSGKSTLINLIPRLYDATDGEVLVDGVNVKDMKLEYLYNKIGYITQKAILFKGTVKSNITFGKTSNGKVKMEQVKDAIRVAQANDFVLKMDKTYDSEIAQSGNNVSGGQKQRLSIARAIARDPEIYIFDDSFSALDYKTDYTLRKELNKYTKDSTKFIVAQRIGTIRDADKIIVLDDGKCVGIGKHKELLNTCKVYREIAESQLSKEELA
mgnify:CR=1 FL=1